jgi:acetyltransferase-like isoleucine patch superfamily enzyme
MVATLLEGAPEFASARLDRSDSLPVDVSGHATLRFPRGAVAHLDWGFGRAYRNEISIWGTEQALSSDRVFTKTPAYEPVIVLRDRRGNACELAVPAAHAHVRMLSEFAAATHDEALRRLFWSRAWRQAELMGMLQRACGHGTHVPRPDLKHVDVRGSLTVGKGVSIDSNVIVKGNVTLGDGVLVEPNCILDSVSIGSGTEIRAYSIVESSQIGQKCRIGPYARIRPGNTIGDGAQIGNFVEVKASFGNPAKTRTLYPE